ncbi:MAG: iron-containing alcohol dehydrogenase [Deltaproteobacteria bacterium]|nr:iron-containing alcohol dehydrogenase [Deltaproteobacteria bacterium]
MKSSPRPESILGKSFECQCGRTHRVSIKAIIYSDDAYNQMMDILGREIFGRDATMLSDQRTYDIAGSKIVEILKQHGWSVESIVVPDKGTLTPRCDDVTLKELISRSGSPDVFLAVGTGVINDLTKWLSFEKNTPYLAVATAGTMNGYTSANVAPSIDGVKQIVRAHTPIAVCALPAVIEKAPFNLIASGLGDIVAKSVSGADWKMNHHLFGEYFCTFCAEIISNIEPLYFNHPERIADRDPLGIKAIFDALLYSGLAMTMIGTSAPASGGEHLFSHTLDMMSSVDGIPHDLHGRQVGLGTIFAAALYERLRAIESPRFFDLPGAINKSFWGKLAGPVSEQYAAKQPHLMQMRDRLSDSAQWNRFRETVFGSAIAPERIANCLLSAGAARFVDDINCSVHRAKTAILHMHEIRKRCTVVDLAWMVGILPDAVDEIMEQWLVRPKQGS